MGDMDFKIAGTKTGITALQVSMLNRLNFNNEGWQSKLSQTISAACLLHNKPIKHGKKYNSNI